MLAPHVCTHTKLVTTAKMGVFKMCENAAAPAAKAMHVHSARRYRLPSK